MMMMMRMVSIRREREREREREIERESSVVSNVGGGEGHRLFVSGCRTLGLYKMRTEWR